MRRLVVLAQGLGLALGAALGAGAEPMVPGFRVEVYSSVPGPVGLSFDAAGNLFVGRDVPGGSGSEALKIRRVPAGGGASADFGPSALPDPDGVLVDLDGSLADAAGAVVVCGDTGGGNGQIVAIRPDLVPDMSLVTLHAASGVLANPSAMERGRDGLLLADPGASAIFEFLPPGPPVVLVPSPSPPASLAVDADARIYVSHADGVIRQYDADGALLDDAFLSGLGAGAALAVATGGAFGSDLYVLDGPSGELLRVAAGGSSEVVGTGFPASHGEIEFGPDGALYVASFAAGEVLRVAPILPPPDLDAFLCYRAKTAKGTPRPEPREVELEDAFESGASRVGKPRALCAPAAGGEGEVLPADIGDPDAHLASYEIRKVDPAARHEPRQLRLANALGSLTLDTLPKGADRLLVPSAFQASAAPPPLGDTAVDAFQCYRARTPRGEPFEPTRIQVADTFNAAARSFAVRAPKHLCLPVGLDGAVIQRPDDLLVCYAAKPAKGQPKTAVRTGLHVGNLFGEDQRFDTLKSATPVRARVEKGSLNGDANETVTPEGDAWPGTWTDLEGHPRWAGGGPLGDGEWLRSSFTDAGSYPEGEVRAWRLFLEIDITENETGQGPGVVMTSMGIPGIPDATELRAMSSGKPRGLHVSTAFFTPPAGTTLADLAGAASLDFQPNGDASTHAFAFELRRWGVEYELVAHLGGHRERRLRDRAVPALAGGVTATARAGARESLREALRGEAGPVGGGQHARVPLEQPGGRTRRPRSRPRGPPAARRRRAPRACAGRRARGGAAGTRSARGPWRP